MEYQFKLKKSKSEDKWFKSFTENNEIVDWTWTDDYEASDSFETAFNIIYVTKDLDITYVLDIDSIT